MHHSIAGTFQPIQSLCVQQIDIYKNAMEQKIILYIPYCILNLTFTLRICRTTEYNPEGTGGLIAIECICHHIITGCLPRSLL